MSHQPASALPSFADGVSLPELVRYLREGVYLMRADGVLLDANPAAIDLLGIAPSATAHVRDASRPLATWRAELDQLALSGDAREFTREFVHADGTRRTVLDTCFARRDGDVVTFHGVLSDITVPSASSDDDVPTRDPATGAFARPYLAHLEAEAATQHDECVGVCVVQVDPPVEHTTDTTHALDERLERLTRFLWRHIRATESIVRSGPHELLLVLPHADDVQTEQVARRVQLAALRGAPAPFRLGWCARHRPDTLAHAADRARQGLVPVRVVEREFQPARQS